MPGMEPSEMSLYKQLRQLEQVFNRLWNSLDMITLETAARRSLENFRRQVRAAQAVARDYESFQMEEDTKSQLKVLPKLIKSLEQTRSTILTASEHDLVGPVDVAQQTSLLDAAIERLR